MLCSTKKEDIKICFRDNILEAFERKQNILIGAFAQARMQEILYDFKKLQDENSLTELMVMQEELKTLPFGDVWAEYCRQCGVAADNYYDEIEAYEKEVLLKR